MEPLHPLEIWRRLANGEEPWQWTEAEECGQGCARTAYKVGEFIVKHTAFEPCTADRFPAEFYAQHLNPAFELRAGPWQIQEYVQPLSSIEGGWEWWEGTARGHYRDGH